MSVAWNILIYDTKKGLFIFLFFSFYFIGPLVSK
jgi:hypothetical protein